MRWIVTGVGVAGVLLAGVAGAATLSPEGGPPGSAYSLETACTVDPQVYVVDLDAGAPPATVVPLTGTEASPGTWIVHLRADDRDQLVTTRCGDRSTTERYDVELPVLLPGPTVATYSDWRQELAGSTVVGTDCPAGATAAAAFSGADGYRSSATATPDDAGDWELAVPSDAPPGELRVDATCASVSYDQLTLRSTVAAPVITEPPTVPPRATAPDPRPATPTFTG